MSARATVRPMPDAEKSAYSHLYDLLFFAGDDEAFEQDGPDPRKGTFDALVKRLDLVLRGQRVRYATHSFTDLELLNAPLEGRVTAITDSVVATAWVVPGSPISVTVVPLTSLTTIDIHEGDENRFIGQSPWDKLNVKLRFEGLKNRLLIPGNKSSEMNAREFDEIYPKLIDALLAR